MIEFEKEQVRPEGISWDSIGNVTLYPDFPEAYGGLYLALSEKRPLIKGTTFAL